MHTKEGTLYTKCIIIFQHLFYQCSCLIQLNQCELLSTVTWCSYSLPADIHPHSVIHKPLRSVSYSLVPFVSLECFTVITYSMILFTLTLLLQKLQISQMISNSSVTNFNFLQFHQICPGNKKFLITLQLHILEKVEWSSVTWRFSSILCTASDHSREFQQWRESFVWSLIFKITGCSTLFLWLCSCEVAENKILKLNHICLYRMQTV